MDSMNQELIAEYKKEEILEALKGMRPTKASGAYDLLSLFY